jgi:transcriptional regulator with XRE-family HTH domain
MNPIFSNNLKKERNSRSWYQSKVANMLSIPQRRLASWEEGRAEPGIKDLAEIIKLYGIKDVVSFMTDPKYRPGTITNISSVLDQRYSELSGKEKQIIDLIMRI